MMRPGGRPRLQGISALARSSAPSTCARVLDFQQVSYADRRECDPDVDAEDTLEGALRDLGQEYLERG